MNSGGLLFTLDAVVLLCRTTYKCEASDIAAMNTKLIGPQPPVLYMLHPACCYNLSVCINWQ